MTDQEKKLLQVLVAMVNQYCDRDPDGRFDSLAESAPEHAIAILGEYGLMETSVNGRIFGRWIENQVARLFSK